MSRWISKRAPVVRFDDFDDEPTQEIVLPDPPPAEPVGCADHDEIAANSRRFALETNCHQIKYVGDQAYIVGECAKCGLEITRSNPAAWTT